MRGKHTRLRQNLAITALSLSALALLGQVVSFEMGLDGTLSSLSAQFSDTISPGGTEGAQASGLSSLSAPMNLVVTGEYGRYGSLLASSSAAGVDGALTLLREALGSAGGGETLSADLFRGLVTRRGVCFDFLLSLPVSLLSGRLQADFDPGGSARSCLIADDGDASVSLYLWDGQGAIRRYDTALDLSALAQVLGAFESNDALFAFEAGEDYAALSPYTLLVGQRIQAPLLQAVSPVGTQSTDDLLALLDFNPHTNSRYPLSNGTEMVVEYPRTLGVQTDGTVFYTGGTEPVSALYQVTAEGETPTQTEAALSALQLAETLLSYAGIDAESLWLSGITETEDGFLVTLDYQYGGIPVYFADGESAVSVEITGTAITAFHCRFRQYTAQETLYPLLPLEQAVAMASSYEGGFLTAGYVDQGSDQLHPTWLTRE